MAGLKTYRTKRHFSVTPEPRGKVERGRKGAFVIQKHAARRLHYDLRLELDGVMKSWAVTRGPSLVPSDKRLAVEVEDHPIDYNKFEGTIPEGQYGGGTVMIWDRGRWQPEGDPHFGLKKGHLAFSLDGEKLSGAWHLVRMPRRSGETRNNWLLIKVDDDAARSSKDKDILDEAPLSVVTGRDIAEIAAGKKAKKVKAAALPKPKKNATRKANPNKTKKTALAGARRHDLPEFVPPCLATLSEKAPATAAWIHEIKFDGYRLQARLAGNKVVLRTRRGLDWTHKFKSAASALEKLPVDTALVDGELVVEDAQGVSSFSLLQQDLSEGRSDRMVFYAFDLLHLDGEDLRKTPLSARKQRLAKLLARAPAALRLSESIDDSGPVLLKHACGMGLEGIISKLRDAPYRSGRGHDWLKTKCSDRQEFVVAGFAPSTADSNAIGSLVLGYYDNGELRYAGRTGTGFTHRSARDIFRKLKPLRQSTTPFPRMPKEERGKNGALWVAPKIVAEVEFHGWTHGSHVRQASFQGLREDKPAKQVVREIKNTADISVAAARKDATATRRSAAPARIVKAKGKTSAGKDTHVGAVRLTHPDRVYWEDAGVTKQQLAEFYQAIWRRMAPHVIDRPLSLVRCPEGISGQCFFQKHASAGVDEKFLRLVREPDGDKVISVDDLDGLIALVQAGALEIHLRGTTTEHLEEGDRIVFDLDPGPGTSWKDVVKAARDVRARLDALKLKSFLKTSGGKGLHVVLPIRFTPWEEIKSFTRGIAEAMEADDPSRYVASATKSKRSKRIFVDYLRNSREATAIAPYSTRARAGAGVATPLAWSELGSLTAADRYTVLNVVQRLSRQRKDPWAGIERLKQALPKRHR